MTQSTAAKSSPPRRLSRRQFFRSVAVAGTAAALVSAADETFFEPWHPVVKHVAITLERLPAIFNDFTIAHLSDFHYHPFFTAKPIARAVLLVNQLEPDLIVLTGDFVTVPLLRSSERSSLHIKAQAEPCSALLAGLRAKLGIVTVLGNHDQDSQPDVVTECLEAQRIKVLRNERCLVCGTEWRSTLGRGHGRCLIESCRSSPRFKGGTASGGNHLARPRTRFCGRRCKLSNRPPTLGSLSWRSGPLACNWCPGPSRTRPKIPMGTSAPSKDGALYQCWHRNHKAPHSLELSARSYLVDVENYPQGVLAKYDPARL